MISSNLGSSRTV